MKIVFLDRKTLGIDISLNQFSKFGEVIVYETTKYEETIEHLKGADIVVTNKVVIDKNIMDQCNIKLICVAATGMNNIDLEYAKEKNIIVKNVAGYSTKSVSQLTFSFVLQFVQRIDYYDNYGKNEWKKSDIFTNLEKPFFELDGKNWGIIGLGEIGRDVASIATSFGCNVSYYSTSGTNYNTNYSQKSLEELLRQSDIITIHSPLNDKTLDLLNSSNIPLIKKGGIVLNLGRGGIVNEKDISEAINNGQDIYYGTDVVSCEPIQKENPLLSIEDGSKLLLTPHIAWGSIEARARLLNGIEDNIKSFLE
jgi:lactate dehydrogenase-like 2-hydroxyacid dehydrogenase